MAHLRRNLTTYGNDGWTYLDHDEKKGYYGQLNVPLFNQTIVTVSGESVTLGAGAAATTGKIPLANRAAILNATGSMLGYYFSGTDKDTSLTLATGDAIDTEVVFDKTKKEADILSNLANGEYAVDYVNGILYYKKTNANTAMTFDYKYWTLKVDTELTLESATISNIKIYSTDNTTANSFLAKGNANQVPYAALTNVDGSVFAYPSDEGSGTGSLPASVYNATGVIAAANPFNAQIGDGTSQVDVIATINSLKSDVSSIGGEIVVADNGAGAGVTKTLPIGGKYVASLPTYTDGDVAMAHFTVNGKLLTDAEITLNDYTDNSAEFTVDTSKGLSLMGLYSSSAVTAGRIAAIGIDGDRNVKITSSSDIPSALTSGKKTVTTAGTAEALDVNTTIKYVVVQALIANTGYIYVGGSTVDATTAPGNVLVAGDSVVVNIKNIAMVYVDSSVDGEGVSYNYFV